MKSLQICFVLIAVALLASCGEPERPNAAAIRAQPFRVTGDFDEVGKVSLFQGESCTSQIMFVFHRAGSAFSGLRRDESTSVSMAAPFRVSKVLTDSAHNHKTVHVSGKWRRAKAAGCSYVEAIQAELQMSFW